MPSRRWLMLAGLAGAVVSQLAEASNLAAHAELVDPFSDALQDRLLPRQPVLALYQRGGRKLAFVAAVHGVDPASETFADIDRAWRLVSPRAVMIEGFPTAWGPSPAKVRTQIAARQDPKAGSYARGEDVYAASLASAHGVPFWGGDPTDGELYAALMARGYKAQDILFQQMFGPLRQDVEAGVFQGPSDPRFAAAFDRWAAIISAGFQTPPPHDVQAFRGWFHDTFGVTVEDDPRWLEHGGPGGELVTEHIGRDSNIMRDRHALELAVRLVNQHGRVLVVYGASHLANQWRALERTFGPPRMS